MKKRLASSLTMAALVILSNHVVAIGQDVPQGWKSLDVPGLTALAKQLGSRNDAAAKAEREQLAAYVAERYAQEAAAGRTVSDPWLDLEAALGPCFPPKAREAMAADITKTVVPKDQQAAAALADERVIRIGRVLAQLGQAESAASVGAMWIGASDRYRASTPETLRALAALVASSDSKESQGARQRIAEHVRGKYLASPEAVRAVTCGQWHGLASALGKDLNAPLRQAWREKLRGAFTEPASLAALRLHDLQGLKWALDALGDGQSDGVVRSWMATGTSDWQSSPPQRLVWLAQNLGGGDEAKTHKRRLAEFLTRSYLGTPEKVRAVRGEEWHELGWHLAETLDDSERTAWAARLRAAFADPKMLVGMVPRDVTLLAAVLDRLGDKKSHELSAAWMSATGAWESARGDDLARLAQQLAQGGEATKALRLRLIEHVGKKLLVTPEAVRDAGAWNWKGLAEPLAKDADESARRSWARRLREARAASETLDALGHEEPWPLTCALIALGEKDPYSLMNAWIASAGRRKTLSPGGLRWLAKTLESAGEGARGSRLILAAYVTQVWLATPESVLAPAGWEWRETAESLSKDLDDKTRQLWREKLRGAYGSPKQMASGKAEEYLELVDALGALGDKEPCGLLLALVSEGTTWQSLDLGSLVRLTDALVKAGAPARGARLRVAEHVAQERLATDDAVRSGRCGQWKDLAQRLAKDLDAKATAAWAGRLRRAFTEAKVLTLLRPGDVSDLAEALGILGDKQSHDVWAGWMSAGPAWQAASPGELAGLLQNLSQDADATKPLRLSIAGYVTGKYLATAEAVRSVPCQQWRALAEALAADIGDAIKSRWVERLRAAYAEEKVLVALKAGAVMDLRAALQRLGDKAADGVALAWMSGGPALASLAPGDLVDLARGLEAMGAVGRPLRLRLAEHLMKTRLESVQAARAVGGQAWKDLANSLRDVLQDAQRRAWMEKLRQFLMSTEAIAAAKSVEVLDLAEAVDALVDKESPAVLTAWMSAGTQWQSLDPSQTGRLARFLAKGDESAKGARQRLVVYLTGKYLATPEAVLSVGRGDWKAWASVLSPDMSAENHRSWAERLRGTLAEPKVLASFDKGNVADLMDTLTSLGDERPWSVASAWMDAGAAWQSLGLVDLRWLIENLQRGKEEAKAARERLVAHVGNQCLGTPEAARRADPGAWRQLCDLLERELTPAARALWADKLVAAYADNQERLSGLTGDQVGDLIEVARRMGGDAKAVALAERAVGARSAADLSVISGVLAGCGDAAKPLRERVAARVVASYAADAKVVRSATIADWARLARNLGGDLPKEKRTVWAGSLRAAYAGGPQALRSVRPAELRDLVDALGALGDTNTAGLVASWMLKK